jgi:hypothetical protein
MVNLGPPVKMEERVFMAYCMMLRTLTPVLATRGPAWGILKTMLLSSIR